MARPPRLEIPGALYWVGVSSRDRPLLLDATDGATFHAVLDTVARLFCWRVQAWAITPKRFELLLETPEATLARGMRELTGNYSQSFLNRHRLTGRLTDGRYRGILVEGPRFGLDVARAVLRIPLDDGSASRLDRWQWSSWRPTVTQKGMAPWLDARSLLRHFDRTDPIAAFRTFVSSPGLDPREAIRNQIFLGSAAFRERMLSLAENDRNPRTAVAQKSRRIWRPELRQLLKAVATVTVSTPQSITDGRGGDARTLVGHLARVDAALPLAEIARALHLGISGASRLVIEGQRREKEDPGYSRLVTSVRRHARKR